MVTETVVPVQCIVCGDWHDVVDDGGKRVARALTCGTGCRKILSRKRRRGERPEYAL